MLFIEDITGNILLNVDHVSEVKEEKEFTYSDDVYELITGVKTKYMVKVGNEWFEVTYKTYEGLKNAQKCTF